MLWWQITLVLSAYGFFKELKPSEAYLTPYLTGPLKNISRHDLSDQIYPVSTYSTLGALLLVFLLTDVLRYKPLIIIEALAYLATRVMLCWGNGVFVMQMMQVAYGIASATEIAYFSYIYAAVEERHFQKVTSYTRSAVLFGRGCSDVLGQVLVSTHTASYLSLNYVSLASVCVAVVFSVFLPGVKKAVFLSKDYLQFKNDTSKESDDNVDDNVGDNIDDNVGDADVSVVTQNCCNGSLKSLFVAFKCSYSNKELVVWSVYWALVTCGSLQVENYVMNLWEDINSSIVYNGAVFCFGTFLGAFIVFLLSLFKDQHWSEVFAEAVIVFVSLGNAALLLAMSLTGDIWVAYVCYVLFRTSIALILAIASVQMAFHIKMSTYGLIFGFNTFAALVLQTILTLVVADAKGLDLSERKQFIVYGCYFGVIALLFLGRPAYRFIRWFRINCRSTDAYQPGSMFLSSEITGVNPLFCSFALIALFKF